MLSTNIFGFKFADNEMGIQQAFIKKHIEKNNQLDAATGHTEPPDWQWLHDLYDPSKKCLHFVATPTFVIASSLVNVRDNMEYAWLFKDFPEVIQQFSYGNSFIRFAKDGDLLNVIYAHRTKNGENHAVVINGNAFQLNMKDIQFSYPVDLANQVAADLLLQLLVFRTLGEVNIRFLEKGQRYQTKRHPDTVFNAHKEDIAVLHSSPYEELIKKQQVKWTLHHYNSGVPPLGRSLEKRPNVQTTI